ncbi:MAG TPA: M28 family peptidase [Anaerolineae bacterium]|nr:M28 family peptidase [Anaerolineae bacterium]
MLNNPHLPADQQIVGDIYTATEAMDNLITLCDDFGSRFGGTAGERLAAQFIKAKLKEYGLSNVHLEPFEYLGWKRGVAALEIISPIQKTLPCITLPHSPPTTLEGVIVDMGDGAPDDFEKRSQEIKDKIVMTTSVVNPGNSKRWIHRNEKYGRSIFAGATGFIFVNHYPGYGPATGGVGHGGRAGFIPAISIAKEDGDFIRRLIKRKGAVKIRLTSSDQIQPMTSWNVIADLPGSKTPEKIVMLGSHYDGHDISQGAGDPASGAVSVMEAARALAKYAAPLPCTLRFALWGVEEIGLLGSTAYTQAHANELSNIRFYLNMDAAGVTDPKDIVLHQWPALQPLFEAYQQEMAADFAIGQAIHAHSDHYPFAMAGVTTGGIESARQSLSGRGYGHTMYDTVDKVSLKGLREASTLGARLALRIAAEENWPVARRDPKAAYKLLTEAVTQEYRDFEERLDAFDAAKNS